MAPHRLRNSEVSARNPDRTSIYVETGSTSPVPVLFWESPRGLYVMPSAGSTRWLAEALQSGGCIVSRPGGRRTPSSAELVTDPSEAEMVRNGFRSKYGEERIDRYFRPHSKVVRLTEGAAIRPLEPAEMLRLEFEADAPGYDEEVRSNAIERYLKETTRDRLIRTFSQAERLLEVGAGTGIETLPLLSEGHRVTVVDVSPRMLSELTARARAAGLEGRLTCREGRLSELAEVLVDLPDASFDGAYSTFGAFNLETDLGSAPGEFARILRPGSRLVFTSLNRPGAFPVLWEVAVGNGRHGLARGHAAIPPGAIRYPLPVYPRNPSYFDRILSPQFRRAEALPVSIAAPPFESPRLLRWLGGAGATRARRWDERLSGVSLLTPLGEWSFLTYVRSALPGRAG